MSKSWVVTRASQNVPFDTRNYIVAPRNPSDDAQFGQHYYAILKKKKDAQEIADILNDSELSPEHADFEAQVRLLEMQEESNY